MCLHAVGEACVRVGFLPGTLRIPIEVIPTQRRGLLLFARLLVLVSTAFAAALARLIAALRPAVLAIVAAVGLALGLIKALSLRWQFIAGLSMLAILLQMLLRFDMAKLHLDCCCHADHPS